MTIELVIYSIVYILFFSIPAFSLGSPMYYLSFFGRKIAPILLLIGFLMYSYVQGKGWVNNVLLAITGGILGLSLATVLVLVPGFVTGVPFELFSNNANWNYIPVFEYVFFLFVGFFLLGRKIGFNYYSFFLVSLALFAAGFMYEIPVIFRATQYMPFHFVHAFFVEPTIIALALLVVMLYFNGVKFGKLQLITGLFFAVYSVLILFFVLDSSSYAFVFPLGYARPSLAMWILEGWLPRVPCLAFLVSIVYGVKKV